MRTVRFKTPDQNEPVEITIERPADGHYCLHFDGESVEVEIDDAGAGRGQLRVHGEIIPFAVLEQNGAFHVWVRGRTFTFQQETRVARRSGGSAAGPTSDAIAAPMPGTIIKICVQPGDEFSPHQPIIIMESMKMEMTLSVPHAGRVRKIDCAVGQLVGMGAVLATLEPNSDAA